MRKKAKISNIEKVKENKDFITRGGNLGYIDKDFYISGWYVDGYIVGPVVDVGDDHIDFEYWCKVDEDTVTDCELVKVKDE